jgi:hypothetical protein
LVICTTAGLTCCATSRIAALNSLAAGTTLGLLVAEAGASASVGALVATAAGATGEADAVPNELHPARLNSISKTGTRYTIGQRDPRMVGPADRGVVLFMGLSLI